jgi:RNA-directed DNA polymerase
MSQEANQTRTDAQAGTPGKAAAVGPEVGGVHSNDELSWVDLWTLRPQDRANLKEIARNAACSHAWQRSQGAGDGSREITTPQKLRKLQRALYRKAKAEPGYRFWSLYSELTRRDLLEHAFELVARNGGAPGVDGQSIGSIRAEPETRERWWTALQRELQTHTYRPSPVRRVYIPKGDGGQRPLGIPTVKDRVVQMVALLVLAPIFEADFHPHSYGFRPRRDAHQAIDAIVGALRQGKLEVVDADVSKYFDTIPHDRLVKLVARRTSDGSVLHLLRRSLRNRRTGPGAPCLMNKVCHKAGSSRRCWPTCISMDWIGPSMTHGSEVNRCWCAMRMTSSFSVRQDNPLSYWNACADGWQPGA